MRIPYDEMKSEFGRILLSRGFSESDAGLAAAVFADNSLDGIYTHGVNRFPRIVSYIERGYIKSDARPVVESSFMAFEKWNGQRGFGPLNARKAMDRAIELARKFGIGLVSLGNSNHWLRGGSYGWQAANAGCIGICWSNTCPNMPAWGGKDIRIGNNPLVISVPRSSGEHVVLDLAVSQFSYGKLEEYSLKGEKLPVIGGFDKDGNLTDDPNAIMETRRVLPMGYWKGSGLSILLDMIATVLTDGNAVSDIGRFDDEVGLSQIMIAIDPGKMNTPELTDSIVDRIIEDIKASVPMKEGGEIRYPGEREARTRRDNLENGIPVIDSVWDTIKRL